MALFGFLVAPPPILVRRHAGKADQGLAHNQFTGTADILETMQESLQGHPHRQGVHARTNHARAHRCQHQ